jgi:taurine--2-oxoglutarate transaminase
MLWTGLTYSGHPVSCATALAMLDVYENEGVFANVERQGAYLAERLEGMKARYACVGDVRYKGLFSMLEFVKDKATKEPLAPYAGSSPEMAALGKHLRGEHLYTYMRFNVCFVAPPLVIMREELAHGLDIMEGGLAEIDKMLGV